MFISIRKITGILILLLCAFRPARGQIISWERVADPDSSTITAIVTGDSGRIYIGKGKGSVFRSSDRGVTWARVDSGLSGVTCLYSAPNGELFAGTYSKLISSIDQGTTWSVKGALGSVTGIISFGTDSLLCTTAETYWADFYRSTDGGKTWAKTGQMGDQSTVGCLAVDDSCYVYAGFTPSPYFDGLYRSTDGGLTWSTLIPTSGTIMHGLTSIVFVNGYIFCSDNPQEDVLRSADGGRTWQSHPGPVAEYRSMAANRKGDLFLATLELGIFRSTDEGQTWDSVDAGVVDRNVTKLAVDSAGYVYAGTQSGIVLRTVKSTTVIKPVAHLAPADFVLRQNSPDPFNPTTTISYRISEVSRVSLKVYDVLGREVATLEEGVQPSGEYKVRFDGTGLTSGVYFYTLRAGSFLETKKLLLIK